LIFFYLTVKKDDGTFDIEQTGIQFNNLLNKIVEKLKESDLSGLDDIILIRTPRTITLVHKFRRARKVQFILQPKISIQEILVFFDLDCVRFAYHEGTVWTMDEGIRSLIYKENMAHYRTVQINANQYRLRKYFERGFHTTYVKYSPFNVKFFKRRCTKGSSCDKHYDQWGCEKISSEKLTELRKCYKIENKHFEDIENEEDIQDYEYLPGTRSTKRFLSQHGWNDINRYMKIQIKDKGNLSKRELKNLQMLKNEFGKLIPGTTITYFYDFVRNNYANLIISNVYDVNYLARYMLIGRCYICRRHYQFNNMEHVEIFSLCQLDKKVDQRKNGII